MGRRRPPEELEFGSDSFLDTLANVVGILIILVVIVGLLSGQVKMQAAATPEPTAPASPAPSSGAPQNAKPGPPAAPKVDLATPTEELKKLTYDFQVALNELKKQALLAAARDQQRMQLAYDATLRKRAIEERRQKLDAGQQEVFALAQETAAMEAAIDRLDQDLVHVQEVPPEVVQLKHDTTPISQTVYGDEIHFRLANGRIAPLPIDALVGLVKRDMERQAPKLKPGEPVESTVGPIDDFRMTYLLEMTPVVMGGPNGQVGTIIQVSKWTMEPTYPDIGEELAAALAPTSRFRTALAQVNPRRAAVTVWVYPESFAAFRTVKEELTRLGYSCAARPLPEGQLISGSPKGSRSNAQ